MSKLLGNLKNVSSLLNNNGDNSDVEIWLDVNLIEPDPEQPRKYFDEAELQNLSASMTYINPRTGKQRGNRQAIVVRPNPNGGNYIIVMGERRWRAAILGKMDKIRARIDYDYVDADEIEEDQLIENIQSANLTPKEIALWIGKKLKQGKKKNELAKTLGKSNSFITQYAALLALPTVINNLFDNNKCNDVTLLNDLATLHKKYPTEVDNWIQEEPEINRNSFKLFKEFLDTKQDNNESNEPNEHKENLDVTPSSTETDEDSTHSKKIFRGNDENDNDTLKNAIVMIEFRGKPAKLILNKKPSWEGLGWIKNLDDDDEFETELKNIKIISIIEG